MTTFYVTFGGQYSREPHPSGETWVHPDGWLTVEAPNELSARRAVIAQIGRSWASIYDEQPAADLFPRGELRRITVVAG